MGSVSIAYNVEWRYDRLLFFLGRSEILMYIYRLSSISRMVSVIYLAKSFVRGTTNFGVIARHVDEIGRDHGCDYQLEYNGLMIPGYC